MKSAARIICMALIAALVCSATAVGAKRFVITKSSQIKPGAITTKNLSASTQKTLRGRSGPPGAQGPAGTAGPTGPAGQAVIHRVFYPRQDIIGATSSEFPMTCPNGVAIGGGAATDSAGATITRASEPDGIRAGTTDATPSRWYVRVVSTTTVFQYYPYIICAG